MANLIPLINERFPKDFQIIIYLSGYCAQLNNYQIYAVGSFVRDLLLNRTNKLISLVVDGSVDDFAKNLQKLFSGRLQSLEKYGKATFFLQNGVRIDMVTAKREFSLHTDFQFSQKDGFLKKDLYGQDFTINTMACSLNPDTFGLLYDYFNGRRDLENGIIRVLYKLSFVDDPLRIIRAVKLEQRYTFEIEKDTLDMLKQAASHQVLNRLSKESIYHEVLSLFKEPSPLSILLRFKELGFLNHFFPRTQFSPELLNTLKELEAILNNYRDTPFFEPRKIDRTVLFLAAIFHNMQEHDIKFVLYLMRLRRKDRNKILALRKMIPRILEKITLHSSRNTSLFELLSQLPEEGLPLLYVSGKNERVARVINDYRSHINSY